MRIPFTLKEWIKDRTRKVFTQEGKQFIVTNYQFDGHYPVRGLYKGNLDDMHYFNEKDLFIETDPELDEFEQAVRDSMFYDTSYQPTYEDIHRQAEKLRSILKKEYVLNPDDWDTQTAYSEGYMKGMEEIQARFPKWKRIKKGEKLPCPAYIWSIAFDRYDDAFEGRLIPNMEGVTVGADTWYLPSKAIHDLPKE